MYLFVVILVNNRHLVFPIGQSNRMDLITRELSHANVGACSKIGTILPKNAHCMLHCNNVTTCPNGNVTTCPNDNVTACPNVILLMTFVGHNYRKMQYILNLANDIQDSVYTHDHGHVHFNYVLDGMYKESFKNHMHSSTWRISVARAAIRVIVHVTCLSVKLNIPPSWESFPLVVSM